MFKCGKSKNGNPLACQSCRNNDDDICVISAKCLQAVCDRNYQTHECNKCQWKPCKDLCKQCGYDLAEVKAKYQEVNFCPICGIGVTKDA